MLAKLMEIYNSFLANVPILYPPLKTPENQTFSGVFRGYEVGILAKNWLNRDFFKRLLQYIK